MKYPLKYLRAPPRHITAYQFIRRPLVLVGAAFLKNGGNYLRKNKTMHRLTAVFLSALLCMSCIGSPMAFAAGPSRAHLSESTDGENPEYLNEPPLAENPEYLNEPPLGEDSDYLNEPPLAESGFELSDAAQAFINAVNALDREKILSTANAWGLAHRAWEQDQDNEALKAALDEAVEASDAAVVPLYAAEDHLILATCFSF